MTAVESRPGGSTGTNPRYPQETGQVPPTVPTSFGTKVGAYVALTKPRIIELLLVSTVPVMFLAADGVPSLWLILSVVFAGYLSAGSANAFNMYIDRDIDAVMKRTERRPLVTGVLTPRQALVFAWVLGVASTLWFGLLVNWLSAALSVFAIFYYVVVYTMGLKRRTPQNIVWGGIAGCMQVLIGWTAVTNSLDWAPFVLFMVIFFWTPPHYWPLSMKYEKDYTAAGVPMLPTIASNKTVARQIVLYSYVMVGVSLLLWPLAPTSWLYPVVAGLLGVVWLREAHRLQSNAKKQAAALELDPAEVVSVKLGEMRLFHWSITYLTLLFVAIAVDPFIP